jgi:hypothetical protein
LLFIGGSLSPVWGLCLGRLILSPAKEPPLHLDFQQAMGQARVYDQGHWELLERAVHLSPAAGWEHAGRRDRRYLPVSLAGHDPYLLLGVDSALAFFEELSTTQVDIAPQEWLSAASFKRQRKLRPSDTQQLKARLMHGGAPNQSRQPSP